MLLLMLTTFLVSFRVGVAHLHPNDKYVKAIGRQIAESNLEMVAFAIRDIRMWPQDNEIGLNLYDAETGYSFKMILKKDIKVVRIVRV